MKLFKYILFISIVLVCFLGKQALAHKLNAAETSIKFNPRTDSLEIIHKFYMHDVNHLTQQLFSEESNKEIINKEQAFVNYILRNLSLKFVPLNSSVNYLGFEQEGKYLYIYQETKVSEQKDIESVRADIKAMQNSWVPTHWLFLIELETTKQRSFVLNKNDMHNSITF